MYCCNLQLGDLSGNLVENELEVVRVDPCGPVRRLVNRIKYLP